MSSNEIPRELRHCVSFVQGDGGRWGVLLQNTVAGSEVRLTSTAESDNLLHQHDVGELGELDVILGFQPTDGRVTPPCLNGDIPSQVRMPILQLVGENFDVQVNAEGEARAFRDDMKGIETMVKDLLRLLKK